MGKTHYSSKYKISDRLRNIMRKLKHEIHPHCLNNSVLKYANISQMKTEQNETQQQQEFAKFSNKQIIPLYT